MRTEEIIELLSEKFTNSVKNKFESVKEIFTHQLIEMSELTSLKNEIIYCIILDLNQASVFSTNHFLERMIKVALIKNHTIDYNYSQIEKYSEKLEESKIKFDSLKLYDSLKLAFENGLINEEQKSYLNDVRANIRNPYSHAEVSKINKNNPDFFHGFMFNIEDVKLQLIKNEPLDLTNQISIPTFSPTFAQLQQEQNSNEIAIGYFKNVYNILTEIEKKILEKKAIT
jgi:hypothetical protein